MTTPTFIAVIPILVGPLQVLLALLPAILLSIGGLFVALLKPSTFKQSIKLLWRLKWSLLALALMVGGTVWGVRALTTGGPAGANGPAEEGAADWPAFRGGPERLGAAPNSPAPLRGGINWAFTEVSKTFYSSPTVAGQRVYATSAEKGVFADRGTICCLDAHSGSLLWKSAPEGFRATFSSPAVAGKYLVCGEGLHFTRDGRVVCLDVSRGGKLLWEYRTRSHVESSPCIAEGRAYIGAGDDGYYCFELEPDANGQARMVWHVPGDKYPDAETSPAVVAGKVFVGLGLGGRALVCLEAASGAELWRVPTPYPVFTPPTVSDGLVYFGMGNGNFIETAAEAAQKELDKLRQAGASPEELAAAEKNLQAAGEVWCVDIATQAVKWKYRLTEVVLGAVVADKGRIFFGSRDGQLYCLDQSGKERGKYHSTSPVLTCPSVTATHVYFVNEAGRLFAVNKETLLPEWDLALGGQGPFLSSPAVAHGRVYVGTANDGLLCAGTSGSESRPEVWAGFLGGGGKAGTIDHSPLPERGALIWRFPATDDPNASPTRIIAPAAALDGWLYVPVASGPFKGLLCFETNAATRKTPVPRWHFATGAGVYYSPACAGNLVYFVEGGDNRPGQSLYCLYATNGSVRWVERLDHHILGNLAIVGSRLAYRAIRSPELDWEESGLRGTLALADTGAVPMPLRWCNRFSGDADQRARNLTVVGLPMLSGTLLALSRRDGVGIMDRETMSVVQGLETAPVTSPILHNKTVYVGTANGVEAFGLLDGNPLEVVPGGAPVTPLVAGSGRLAWINDRGEVLVANLATGELLANLPGALTNVPPVITRDALLYATADSLMTCNLTDFTPRRWMATGWLGKLTSPMILADSTVYFATDQKGLICAGKR